MVPVCKSLGSLCLQIERGSGLLSSCPLQNPHNYRSLKRSQNSLLRHKTSCIKANSAIGSEDKSSAPVSAGRMVKDQPDASVDINIAKAMLDYINASWTPYHAVGATEFFGLSLNTMMPKTTKLEGLLFGSTPTFFFVNTMIRSYREGFSLLILFLIFKFGMCK